MVKKLIETYFSSLCRSFHLSHCKIFLLATEDLNFYFPGDLNSVPSTYMHTDILLKESLISKDMPNLVKIIMM